MERLSNNKGAPASPNRLSGLLAVLIAAALGSAPIWALMVGG